MSNSIKAILALSVISFLAACAAKEEVMVIDVEPVTEDVVSGKYGS